MIFLHNWYFWLAMISLVCIMLERMKPWRSGQSFWTRPQVLQDWLLLLINNVCIYPVIIFILPITLIGQLETWLLDVVPQLDLKKSSLVIQCTVLLVIKDFWEWCIHNSLHRIPLLWKFHQLHHSLTIMDWIGNYRFHWMEIVIYRTCSWLPLLFVSTMYTYVLIVGVFSTLIGSLNHSNIRTDWGLLRYIFNSPRLHLWHHDIVCHKPCGQNFAIVFSIWDWLFGTMWYPDDIESPDELGFKDLKLFPKSLLGRLLYPFIKVKEL